MVVPRQKTQFTKLQAKHCILLFNLEDLLEKRNVLCV